MRVHINPFSCIPCVYIYQLITFNFIILNLFGCVLTVSQKFALPLVDVDQHSGQVCFYTYDVLKFKIVWLQSVHIHYSVVFVTTNYYNGTDNNWHWAPLLSSLVCYSHCWRTTVLYCIDTNTCPSCKLEIKLTSNCCDEPVVLPVMNHIAYTIGLLNSEHTTKGHSSVVDTISFDPKLYFFITELLTKGQSPIVDTLKSSQDFPYQRSSTVFIIVSESVVAYYWAW